MSGWKSLFGVTLIQAVVSKTLKLFYKIVFCLQNIRTPKKNNLFTLLRAKINGVGHNAPPPSFSFVKIPPSFVAGSKLI